RSLLDGVDLPETVVTLPGLARAATVARGVAIPPVGPADDAASAGSFSGRDEIEDPAEITRSAALFSVAAGDPGSRADSGTSSGSEAGPSGSMLWTVAPSSR